ncbi:hypothetical protein [Coleofasciculus chthonoplastes]|uniref:hypothetical protein n=1 Tax=Coleofasciculus chthonoplastes TaxID=64178 RepID=UPI0032F1F545
MSTTNSAFESIDWHQDCVNYIYNELKELGKTGVPLGVEDLIPFDQLHPLSTTALDEAVKQLGLSPFSKVKVQLTETLACPYLPTRDQYLADLAAAGFVDLHFEDVTHLWQPWEIQRAVDFEQNKSRHLRVHGDQVVQSMRHRYQVWAELLVLPELLC